MTSSNPDAYAGVGSRQTPADVLLHMTAVARELATLGWTLRSGGATGADTAFERGCDAGNGVKEILLYNYSGAAHRIAASVHPNWESCNTLAWRLHARNVQLVLGKELDIPTLARSKFVACWTPGGAKVGGTATAIRVAQKYNVPVFNFAIELFTVERMLREVAEYGEVKP